MKNDTSITNRLDSQISIRVALIFVAAFALYFISRSPGLDELDSVQLAMGIREFNIWKHQPHPPGYPLYIFLGWSGTRLFGWSPEFSLHFVSCLGGALFIAAWFLIIRLQFSERFAWLIAGSLAITPVVWMTSTKVLTDSLAAGLLSLQLFCSLLFRNEGRIKHLVATAIFGAAATGARPQLIAVAFLIVATPLLQRRVRPAIWLIGSATFIWGCLLWLGPMWYIQSTLPGAFGGWRSYPAQLYSQWRWRLHRPDAFIGGGRFSLLYFGKRFGMHIMGWFGIGFGFLWSAFALVAAALLITCGFFASFTRVSDEDRKFWKSHWRWAALHIAIVFCFLPADQRYYLIIMPLLLVALLRGFVQMPKPFPLAALFLPALLLGISIPLAIENHSEEAPPIKLVRFLQRRYPPEQRGKVLLFLTHCQRHFKWYAPEFTVFSGVPFSSVPPERLAEAEAIYADESALARPPGWRLSLVAEFQRSVVNYRKHHDIRLYRVESTAAP